MVIDNGWPDTRVEREAQALVRRGYAVDVICTGSAEDLPLERSAGLTIHRLRVARRRGMGARVQLLEYVAFLALATAKLTLLDLRFQYQVVHVHNVPDFLVFCALWPKLRGASVILDVHDLTPEFFESRFGKGPSTLSGRLVRFQERAATWFADHVITVTEAWRETLISRGVSPEKLSVVMNLPDDEVFRQMPPSPGGDAAPFTLLYHGTLTHRYGIDLLLEAVARVREVIPLHLILHGTGEYLVDLQELAARLKLDDGTVRFSTAMLPTHDLPQLIRTADVGVVPNRLDSFTDGILPTKLLEYVAIGVPAIVARTSATLTHFDDSMVRYFTPGDIDDLAAAIVDLHGDPEGRQRLADNARRFFDENRWQTTADAYANLVERASTRSGAGV